MQEPSWRCSAQSKSGHLPDMPALGFVMAAWSQNGRRPEISLKTRQCAVAIGLQELRVWSHLPHHQTIGELKEWEDAVKTPVPKECKGVLNSQGCLMLVAGSQNTGHKAKASDLEEHLEGSPLYISHWW